MNCRRICLGVLPLPADAADSDLVPGFVSNLKSCTNEYFKLKKDVMPSVDKVEADPLSALGLDAENGDGDQWKAFEKNQELSEFIVGDLDRLYLTGIDDDYFMTGNRKEKILSILLLWSNINKDVSYRQGMHEIAAPIYYALEREQEALKSKCPTSPFAACCANDDNLEAHCYWMFEAVMRDIVPLYDPTPRKKGTENQPEIVHFVTSIQEKFLKAFDPELCEHLDNNYVYPQVYGMRWSRLLFGREFSMTHTQSFRLWDYMFASMFQSNSGKKPKRYGDYGPIMDEVGDMMLAMMLNIRQDLIEGDGNDMLGLLMHYPATAEVYPILQVADKIGKGQYTPPNKVQNRHSDASTGASSFAKEVDDKALPSWMTPNNISKTHELFSEIGTTATQKPTKIISANGSDTDYTPPLSNNSVPKKIVPKANLDGDLGLKDTIEVNSSHLDDLFGDESEGGSLTSSFGASSLGRNLEPSKAKKVDSTPIAKAASTTLATGVHIGDRLLDVCQILSRKSASAEVESKTRKESAQKLRQLVDILDSESVGTLEVYDTLVKNLAAGATTEKAQSAALDQLLGL